MIDKHFITSRLLDPISVYFEDFRPKVGKVIIEVYGKAWSHTWGAMWDGYDTKAFFLRCDNDYLFGKFSSRSSRSVPDYDGFEDAIKAHVMEYRRLEELTKEDAKRIYDNAGRLADEVENCDATYFETFEDLDLLFGTDGGGYRDYIPQKYSNEYNYLCEVFDTIKDNLGWI